MDAVCTGFETFCCTGDNFVLGYRQVGVIGLRPARSIWGHHYAGQSFQRTASKLRDSLSTSSSICASVQMNGGASKT